MLNKNKLIVAAIFALATVSESKAQWNLNGNTGITTTNWLGTINNVPLTVKTNNAFHTIFNNNGTVGIGLSNPIDKLHLHGAAICNGEEQLPPENGDPTDQYCVGFRLSNTLTGSGTMDGFSIKLIDANTIFTAWENNASISFLTQAGSINFNQKVSGQTYKRLGVHGNGNVYVGNITPSAKLHVKSESTSDWLGFFENNAFDSKGLKIKTGKFGSVNAGNVLELGTDKDGSYYKVFTVNANNGKTYAREIIVDLQTNWPDYVFESNYQMLSLKDLEAYILENKHLPGVKSANEVKEQGVNIVENQAALLEQIEQLTLRLIEMNKEIELLKKK